MRFPMPMLNLADGYYDLPPGKMANVVTCLEMLAPPSRPLRKLEGPWRLERIAPDDLASYRALYRHVGEDWMWFSRTIMSDEKLAAIIGHPDVIAYALTDGTTRAGLLELDFREADTCELAFLGLHASALGKGLGRAMTDEGTAMAWAKPIKRYWVHTCTLDSPDALAFYIRSGFTPYARKIEIHDDHRLTAKLPRTAAPHIPLIG